MGLNRRDFLLTAAGFVSGAALPNLAVAADWPSGAVTGVVGYKPGGGTDFASRAIVPLLEERLKNVSVRITNNPGASASRATDLIWTKPADGHWWLFTSGFNRGLRSLGLHHTTPFTDWQFYQADTTLMSVSVRADSPFMELGDLLRAAQSKSARVRVSHSGKGGSWHLGGTLMKKSARIEYVDVPYKGGKPAVLACLNGEVDVVTSGLHEHIQHIRKGTLRNLAVATSEPISLDGITLAPITEAIPSLQNKTPFGGGTTLALRRNTDSAILKQIANAWTDAVSSDEFGELERSKFRFPSPAVGHEADRNAALWETVAANLLFETGVSRLEPGQLGLPAISEFDAFWPPKGYQAAF